MKRCATLALLTSITAGAASAADPVELSAFIALARPEPTLQVRYGSEPPQGIDIFLPAGGGPHPVAILIHGGCWSTVASGREQMRHLGADLAERGIAVWSLGYRRANEAGGGYPGTFQDVSAAIDRLREEAPTYHLDLSRTVLVGHSAGGHLALWATARKGLPPSSPMHLPSPFMPRAVISLAGVGDLNTDMTQQEIAFQLGVNQGRVNEVLKRGKWLVEDPQSEEAQARDKAKARMKRMQSEDTPIPRKQPVTAGVEEGPKKQKQKTRNTAQLSIDDFL